MEINEISKAAYDYAEKQGFHKRKMNLGEQLMLVVAELSEALEADRKEHWSPQLEIINDPQITGFDPFEDKKAWKKTYESLFKGTVEEELADAIIRIGDIAAIYSIDLNWHIKAKMAYNATRPYLHGKKYG
jgi:NTP pyrophosphatase (non-canonical NTP hydrolase)